MLCLRCSSPLFGGGGIPEGVTQGNEPQEEIRLKTGIQIDFVNLDKTCGNLMTGSLSPMYLSTVQFGKSFLVQYNPQCTKKCNYIDTQFRVHIISSKKAGSRSRLPILIQGPRGLSWSQSYR